MQKPKSTRTRHGWRGRTLLAAAIGLVVVAATLSIGWLNGADDAITEISASAAPEWFTVRRISFPLTVIAAGELEAKRQVELKSQVEGTTTIVEVIPEGTAVSEGDLIVKLADDQLLDKLVEEELDVETAQADTVAAEQNLAIKENEAESTIKVTDVKLQIARLARDQWEKGDLVKKRRKLKLTLEKSNRNMVRSRRDLELSEQLYKEKFISWNELEDNRIGVIEAEAELETATLDGEVFEQITFAKEQQKFSSDVEQAEAELDRARRKHESELARARANLLGKGRRLKIRQDRLTKLNEQLANTTILAPQDGLVVYATSTGRSWRRNDPIAQGRQVRLNETIIILPDTHQMVAELKVHEAMVREVTVGLTASVTIDARPATPIKGQVSQIAVMAEDGGWWNRDLRQYAVKIDLPPGFDAALKPAMRCTGQIFIGQVDDALAVPVQAVFTEGQERFVYVKTTTDTLRRQRVEISQASETLAAISQGLSEGDRVLIRRPKPGEEVTKSE